jgi:ribosomal protein S18 acetylase RimI-like enzyme
MFIKKPCCFLYWLSARVRRVRLPIYSRLFSPLKVYSFSKLLLNEDITIQISESTSEHLSFAARLLNEEYKETYEFIPFNEERVLSQIRRRDIKILVAEENWKVLGLIGTHSEEHGEKNIRWLAVDKGDNRAAIEDMLVKEIEKRTEGDTVTTMVDEGSPRIIDWVRRGYVQEPGYQRMSAKLDGLKPIPQIPTGFKLRSLRPGEEEELVSVVNTGFGWQRLELGDLETWRSEDPPFNEEWIQVAEAGKKIVSTVVAKPDTEYNRYMHLKMGYLGPAATLPEFRNQHLGSALTARAMNLLFEKGLETVRLGTAEKNVSSIALLRSLGFQVDNVRKILRKKLKNT